MTEISRIDQNALRSRAVVHAGVACLAGPADPQLPVEVIVTAAA
jgi:hypothetical protein